MMPAARTAASSSPTRATRRARARRRRRRESARAAEESAGHHRRHHLLGVDSDPDLGHRPGKIVQVSPASSSPTLTTLGREGKTNGIFFRTITSDALQGTAAAKYALDQGFKKIAVIHVNNDFGVNMVNEFAEAYKALGGEIVSVTPYNEKQSSYDAEATAAMAGNPDGALPHRHAGRRRDDRPRLDFAGRPGQVPAQRRHEQPGLHLERRREISQRRLRHLVGHQPDRIDRIFQRQLQGVLRRHRSGQSGGRPLL